MNAQVIKTSEASMTTSAGSMVVAASGGCVAAVSLIVGFTIRLLGSSCAANNNLGQDLSGTATFISECAVGMKTSVAFFFIVGMVVGMSVIMVMVVTTLTRSVGVTMATEDKETDEVREETSGTHDKHELGVADLRGFDESGKGFEDDGNAEGDKEDGVEEST